MAAIGAPVESITIGGRYFAVAADSDVTRDLGGSSRQWEPNGDGSARAVKSIKTWKVSGLSLHCDDDIGDQEFLQANLNSNSTVAVTVTFGNGAVYQGSGGLAGDELMYNNTNATVPVELAGPGSLTKQ